MERTLNYTGRDKIEKQQALFSFLELIEGFPVFDVVFNLDEEKYPDDAALYVEAYYKETRQRFCFGTIGKICPPKNRILDKVDTFGPTNFRVLVVDESGRHGMLLASGERFRADESDEGKSKSSILAIRKYPMGQLPWRVSIEPGAAPELQLNDQISNPFEKMKSDARFQSLVLPAALREVLIHYLWNNEDEDSEHCEKWMAFAAMLGPQKPEVECPQELNDWVTEIVGNFSKQFHLLDKLVNAESEN